MVIPKFVSWFFVCTFFAVSAANLLGQPRDQARIAVDVVLLKNQKPIRGFVLRNAPDELQIAVSKVWLEKEDREAFLKAKESSQQIAAIAKKTLVVRLQKLLNAEEKAVDQRGARTVAYEFFLRKQLERAESELENPDEDAYQFVILKIKPNNLLRINLASDQNRKLAVWSWYERLLDIETRKPSSLVDELKQRKVEPTLAPPDLSDRFYPTEESDEFWATRIAIASHRLDKSIEFQGSGDVMLLVNSQEPQLDLPSLMGQMIQSQMNELIQELTATGKKPSQTNLEDTDWVKAAISKAEEMRAKYFRVTNVRTNLLNDMSTVDSAFFVEQPNGKWMPAWQATFSQNISDQKPDAIRRIAEDPQVKAIQSQFQAAAGEGLLDKGMRVGAATLAAQKMANEEFQQFTDRYLKSLSYPPVIALKKKP